MGYAELIKEIKLEGKIIAATRINHESDEEIKVSSHCVFKAFDQVLNGQTLILKRGATGCNGFNCNAGFNDEMPDIPGGYGLFLSYGAGNGFRPGERLKCNPEIAENFFSKLPKNVMDNYNAIQVEPYNEDLNPDIVISFVTPDQLAALSYLHEFRYTEYDNIIAATAAGCASVFRIPFSEQNKSKPRAVIGNIDIASRPYMDKNLIAFTVVGKDFKNMIKDLDDCFIHSPFWSILRKRIHQE